MPKVEEIAEELAGQAPETLAALAAEAAPGMVRERFQFGSAQAKLPVAGTSPNFHYHWANDYPGRIQLFEAAGYMFVKKGEVTLLPGVTPRDNELGDRVSAIVGRNDDGSPLKAYLMKKAMHLYLEDQKRGQERPDAIDAAIKSGRITDDTRGGSFYVPKGSPIKMSRSKRLDD